MSRGENEKQSTFALSRYDIGCLRTTRYVLFLFSGQPLTLICTGVSTKVVFSSNVFSARSRGYLLFLLV